MESQNSPNNSARACSGVQASRRARRRAHTSAACFFSAVGMGRECPALLALFMRFPSAPCL